MSILKKLFKKEKTKIENHPAFSFVIHLLMDEMCDMPSQEDMHSIMSKHLGETHCFQYNETCVGFEAKKYLVNCGKEKKQCSPQLMITKCFKSGSIMDNMERSQIWDCPNGNKILDSCKYQVMAVDMLAAGLNPKERAQMLVDYIEALVELYPNCKAVVFDNSKKMFTRDDIVNCSVPKESKFIHYAVNIRFFRIDGTNDMLIDSVGMSTLFLPDLQYHFCNLEPNDIVRHAYNVLLYIFENENPIESGDVIDGLLNGKMSDKIPWKVQYETSIMGPTREVIDVNMDQFAAGER